MIDAFFQSVSRADFFRDLAPALHIDAGGAPSALTTEGQHGGPRGPWPASGYVELAGTLDSGASAALAGGVAALRAHGLHPAFLYVYDETWFALEALRHRLAPLLGATFDVLSDVWAWHIDPRIDRGGWSLHRGWSEDVRDPQGNPGLVNAWIALTDATERNACMHLVPLDRDPHYPHDLGNLGDLERQGIAVPAAAGTAIAWDANVAHWGGTCDPSFDAPRISMSFTLWTNRRIALDRPVLPPRLTFSQRLDLIAEQFEIYGERELDPLGKEMRWARAVNGMRRVAGRVL